MSQEIPIASSLAPGTRIAANYESKDDIASGASSVVYRARQIILEKDIALKWKGV